MADNKPKTALDRHHRIARNVGIGRRLRAYLVAGILVTTPLAITAWMAISFVTFMDNLADKALPDKYNPETYLPFSVPGIGLVLVVVGLMLIGWLAAGFFGRLLIKVSEYFLDRMPVIRNVYSSLKQILETVLSRKANAFREVVLLEYPRKGVWSIGFVTGQTKGEVQGKTEADMLNIFLPTTPNPTSGFLLFIPRDEVKKLDMTVEEGIKMVISAGMVVPAEKVEKKAGS